MRRALATICVLAASLMAVAGHGAAAPTDVTVWQGSIAGSRGTAPDATVRTVVTVSAPVSRVRVRLSNQYGTAPLVIRSAWAGQAMAGGQAALRPGTNRRLAFGGRTAVSIGPGSVRWSDPVNLSLPAGGLLAVSVHAPGQPAGGKTFLTYAAVPPAMYVSNAGDHGAEESGAAYPTSNIVEDWYRPITAAGYYPGQAWWVDAVAGRSPAHGTVVAVGDSITEGYGAYGPPGQRFTDVLAARLQALPANRRMAVSNAAISGNTASVQTNPYQPPTDPYGCCGQPIVQRLARDVTTLPGVRAVMLLSGTNDIAGGPFAQPSPPGQVTAAIQAMITRLKSQGMQVIGATLLPMGLEPSNPREQARQQVNAWIRGQARFDHVIDFDRLMADPLVPWRIRPSWASSSVVAPTGGVYHPNAAGHAVMGARIPLGWLAPAPTLCPTC